ncbi:MAG TPA: exopolyphosphatase, partial [Bacteroidetes bacterium]|nr:exopolyphosphatase [Bacteroidota bacterium]
MNNKLYAAIDIGTNAGRMLIGKVINDNGYYTVKQIQLVRVPLRLGEDVFDTGAISDSKIKQFILTMKSFKFLAKAYGIKSIVAYSTSAMREANNAKIVIEKIKKKTKINLKVIDGEREAELIFKSFNINGFMGQKPFLFID